MILNLDLGRQIWVSIDFVITRSCNGGFQYVWWWMATVSRFGVVMSCDGGGGSGLRFQFGLDWFVLFLLFFFFFNFKFGFLGMGLCFCWLLMVVVVVDSKWGWAMGVMASMIKHFYFLL